MTLLQGFHKYRLSGRKEIIHYAQLWLQPILTAKSGGNAARGMNGIRRFQLVRMGADALIAVEIFFLKVSMTLRQNTQSLYWNGRSVTCL